MEELDSLFKADCNEEPDRYRRDMDEEVFPGMDDFVRRVDVTN